MKKIIMPTFVLSLLFVGLCTTSLFAKTQYSCDGKVTSYGELSCSSSKSNGWSHTSQYVFYGSNITCQVWIRDADYNERTKSATRALQILLHQQPLVQIFFILQFIIITIMQITKTLYKSLFRGKSMLFPLYS